MSDDFVDYVMELFGPFGTVAVRRMFGGHGMFLDGLMFALLSGDALYLKADEMNRGEFELAGCEIFSYARKGRRATLNFFRAPEGAMESPELMLPWARTAYAAALRANAKKLAAGQAHSAARIAQQQPAETVRAAKPASKQPVKKAPATKPAGRKAPGTKRARPARPAKRGKRAG